MAALRYKGYLIIATCQYDRTKSLWRSIVDLSWGSDPYRGSHVIDDSVRSFQTAEEAQMFGIETDETWVDERLRRLGP
jgi:hypothetical protein